MGESMTTKDIVQMSLIRPITLNFTEPMVFLLNLYIALIYGLLYIWFESFPIVFVQIYGFNLGEEGLAFIGILVGAVVTLPFFFYYLHKRLEPEFDENGDLQPEKRLPPAFVGGFAIVICLFWFGWSSRELPVILVEACPVLNFTEMYQQVQTFTGSCLSSAVASSALAPSSYLIQF